MIAETLKINLKERFNSKNLGMNLTAKGLFQEISNTEYQKYIIDFSDIQFIGRSFTQEYLYQKITSDKCVEEINVAEDVQKMFEVVEKDFE